MNELETIAFLAALVCLGIAVASGIWTIAAVKTVSMATNKGQIVTVSLKSRIPGLISQSATLLGLIFITLSLIARATISGHGPFSNMYEFATAFSWGIVAMGLIFWMRYKIPFLSTIGSAIAIGLLVFAYHQHPASNYLVPALQQSLLLTTHVASAVISYGAFTIGCAAAVMYLIRSHQDNADEIRILDEISYRTVMVGFPFMTLVLVLGALWANVAWGSYWSWDPKETASLVTWLLYAAYLHVRVLRGWQGRPAAILLIIGFAAVVFTFFGNYFFAGLHAY